MHRSGLPLLVLLVLSLNDVASALTFKSDGTVIQNDGTVVQSPKDMLRPTPRKSKAEAEAAKTDTISNNQQIVNNTPDWCLICLNQISLFIVVALAIKQSEYG